MAPQRLEKIGSAPGNGMGSEALKSLDAELKSVPVFRHPNSAANIRFAEAPKVLAASPSLLRRRLQGRQVAAAIEGAGGPVQVGAHRIEDMGADAIDAT